MSQRAVFLDLNGTLVMPVQVTSPEEYAPIEGSLEAVRLLTQAGCLCPVVTVQSRIEKGIYSQQAFLDWFAYLQETFRAQGAVLLGPHVCPHRVNGACACRKPNPTLYRQAAEAHGIDCQRSYVVGDTGSDMLAGRAIGATCCMVRTGWAARDLDEYGPQVDFVGDDILAVAQWIIADLNSV